MEDRYCQAEVIVFLRSSDIRETRPVQLWWRKLGNSNQARKGLAVSDKLKTIRIYERDRAVLRNQDAGVIEVADDAAGKMNFGDGSGDVRRDADKESVVLCREHRLARFRAV